MKPLSLPSVLKDPPFWMRDHEGAEPLIVSSRIRIARNLRGLPFPQKAEDALQQSIVQDLLHALDRIPMLEAPGFAAMDQLSETERSILYERHLVSAELIRLGRGSGVVVDPSAQVAVMINEEDHLRMHAFRPGLDLEDLWRRMNALESAIARALPFAFRADLGYLTACPSNVGTGMRASVMLHLAGLSLRGELDAIMRGARELGLTARGAFGEGSEPAGGFVQLSNQSTLGEDEPSILRRLSETVRRLARAERGTRRRLLAEDALPLRDAVGRALGTLRYAHSIGSDEAFRHLGTLRLGAHCGLLPSIDAASLDPLLVDIQPGHLRRDHAPEAEAATQDPIRAELIRHRLFPDPARSSVP